jgi:hypothetical protein
MLNNKNRKYLLRVYEILLIATKLVCPTSGATLSMLNYCINKYIVCTDEIEVINYFLCLGFSSSLNRTGFIEAIN